MGREKKHTAEQIVNLLRQVEGGLATGTTLLQASKEAEIVQQTYYRWRREYDGLNVNPARRLKELNEAASSGPVIPTRPACDSAEPTSPPSSR